MRVLESIFLEGNGFQAKSVFGWNWDTLKQPSTFYSVHNVYVLLHSFIIINNIYIVSINCHRVYACTMRQSIFRDTHTNKINVEVADYWMIVLYLMGSVTC